MSILSSSSSEDSIGIAGTGNVAKAVGALLQRSGLRIAAVGGRRIEAAVETAKFVAAGLAVPIDSLAEHSRKVLIAVADDAISLVASELAQGGLEHGVVLHTSGSAGPDALALLRDKGNSVGVIHPLQSIPSAERGLETLPGAMFAYAGDREACEWAEKLIHCLGGKPLPIDSENWQYYHAAAVMACNYHATLVDAALELMTKAGIATSPALEALAPMIRSTTENILSIGPDAALTGPIRRGDAGTIRRHMIALQAVEPTTRDLYAAAGRRTVALATRAGLPASAAREVATALKEQEQG